MKQVVGNRIRLHRLCAVGTVRYLSESTRRIVLTDACATPVTMRGPRGTNGVKRASHLLAREGERARFHHGGQNIGHSISKVFSSASHLHNLQGSVTNVILWALKTNKGSVNSCIPTFCCYTLFTIESWPDKNYRQHMKSALPAW